MHERKKKSDKLVSLIPSRHGRKYILKAFWIDSAKKKQKKKKRLFYNFVSVRYCGQLMSWSIIFFHGVFCKSF